MEENKSNGFRRKKKESPPIKNPGSPWEYLWYALYAFAGLGLELLLIGAVEPLLFGGRNTSGYADLHRIIHWLLTIMCWGLMSFFIVRSAGRQLGFCVINRKKPETLRAAVAVALMILCITVNAFDWGNLKLIGEFQNKSLMVFIVQYVYYMFEIVLVYLILVFGQNFVEKLLHRSSNMPWGGVVLCFTWGAVHMLSKGSITTGLFVMGFSLIYGIIYILLGRNTKWSYLVILLAFIV